MKRVIDGVLYNTATAEFLGTDFNLGLYRNKAGRYCVFDTVRILPMTRQEAMEWAEKHLSGDNYIRAFGEPEDGVEEVRARLPAVLVARLRNKAEEMEVSMSALILDMVTMYVK